MSKLVNASKYKRWQEERNEQRKKKGIKKWKNILEINVEKARPTWKKGKQYWR